VYVCGPFRRLNRDGTVKPVGKLSPAGTKKIIITLTLTVEGDTNGTRIVSSRRPDKIVIVVYEIRVRNHLRRTAVSRV